MDRGGYAAATMLFALLLSCTPDIQGLYDREQAQALARATGTPSTWAPDLVLGLTTPTLNRALEAALDVVLERELATLQVRTPVGLTAEVRPALRAESVRVRPDDACAGCFTFDALLKGPVHWKLGPAEGRVPVSFTAAGQVQVAIEDNRRVTLSPRGVKRVRLTAGELGAIGGPVDEVVQEWIRTVLADRVGPLALAELDPSALPLRAVRLATGAEGAALEVLTDVPGSGAVRGWTWPPDGGALMVSETALTGLARRAAFQAGVQEAEIAVDPRALRVDGTGFTLDLRVYRLVGRGWWRDYDVRGDLLVQKSRLHLVAREARQVEESPGAGIVDPLAALFQGKVLEAVVDNLHGAIPGKHRVDAGPVRVVGTVRAVDGRDGQLYALLDIEAKAR